jgi:hypothetical protein
MSTSKIESILEIDLEVNGGGSVADIKKNKQKKEYYMTATSTIRILLLSFRIHYISVFRRLQQ